MTRAQDADARSVEAVTRRAELTAALVMSALTDARATQQLARASCLDAQLSQLNSVMRSLRMPNAAEVLGPLHERVETLTSQARQCGGIALSDGQTTVTLTTPHLLTDAEPRWLEYEHSAWQPVTTNAARR